MVIRIIRFISSLLLLPACAAMTVGLYKGIASINGISQPGSIFILGALAYSIVRLFLFKLDFLYVLAHEVTHAAAALFSGGRVAGIKVSAKEGSVKTTTPNLFVILSPYLVPAYTVFMAALYFTLSFFMHVSRFLGHFIFLTGFTLMFHLSYTAESIRGKQSDLLKAGYLFSICLIYIVNILIVFTITSLLFKEVSFFGFLSDAYESSSRFYCGLWKKLFL